MNSAASYNASMAKVLDGAKSLDSFVDDVICYTVQFEAHLMSLRDLFTRMRRAHLVLKPSKTYLGYKEIEFLEHTTSENRLGTSPISRRAEILEPLTRLTG